jgi:hypothetical protein
MTDPIKVRVSFDYQPDEGDPDDATGLTADEHLELSQALAALGAENIEMERV